MKILHTSDWHFGKSAAPLSGYADEQRHFLRQMTDLIREEDIGAVLCAGDVYDFANVAADAVELYGDAATEICLTLGKDMVVIAGNHDSAERLSACGNLLEKAHLHIRGKITDGVRPVLLDGGKVAVYPLPFFQTAAAKYLHSEVTDMASAVRCVLEDIRAEMDPKRCNILMAHLAVAGSELSESDRSASLEKDETGHFIGGSVSVRPSLFAGFDYVALGHIHKAQQLSANTYYSGSPMAYSFGREEKQQKGVWVFDTETKQALFHAFTPLHPRLSLTCTYAEALARNDLDNTYLSLTVTDRACGAEMIADLREHFPYLMELRGRSNSEWTLEENDFADIDPERLDPKEVLERFLQRQDCPAPESDLVQWFVDAFERAEKEGEL